VEQICVTELGKRAHFAQSTGNSSRETGAKFHWPRRRSFVTWRSE